MPNVLKTWHDMDAHLEDLPKVLDVTRAQIYKSLKKSPSTMADFGKFLPNYESVLNDWKNEVAEKNSYDKFKHKPVIKELIEALGPDIYGLIRDQRISCIVRGEFFLYSSVICAVVR